MRNSVLILFLLLKSYILFAQGDTIIKKHKNFFYFSQDIYRHNEFRTGSEFSFGFTTGFNQIYSIKKNIFIRIGLNYSYRKISDKERLGLTLKHSDWGTYVPYNDYIVHEIQIPLILQYNIINKTKWGYYIGIGFLSNFKLSASYKVSRSSTGEVKKFFGDPPGNVFFPFQPRQAIVLMGFYYTINKRITMLVEPTLVPNQMEYSTFNGNRGFAPDFEIDQPRFSLGIGIIYK